MARTALSRLLAVAAAVAVVAAACGNDDADTGAPATDEAATEEAATEEATEPAAEEDAGSGDVAAAAAARVDEYRVVPEDVGVSAPLSSLPEGRTLYYMQCSAPVCEAIGNKVVEAGELLGMTVTRLDLGASPDTVAEAWNRAVEDMPDGIVGTGFPPPLYQDQLAALAAAGVPYVGLGFSDCDALRDPCPAGAENGMTANLFGTPDVDLYGSLMADYVIADSGGTGSAVFFHIPDFNLHGPMLESFVAQVDAECADCAAADQAAQILDIGTEIPNQVVSYLQANPDTTHVVMAFGDMAIGVPEAIDAAGLGESVTIISQSSGPASYAYIDAGQVQVADFALPYGLLGYRTVDIVARAIAGDDLEAAAAPLPRQVLEQGTIVDSDQGFWPGVEGYEQVFQELWGVGS